MFIGEVNGLYGIPFRMHYRTSHLLGFFKRSLQKLRFYVLALVIISRYYAVC